MNTIKPKVKTTPKFPINLTMDNMKPVSDHDSDIILIDNPPETISIEESSPERRKNKKKKPKRKVQVGIDQINHMETLRVTQKLKVKKSKFRCIIDISNIKTAPKKRKRKAKKSSSIRGFSKNQYKLPTYYERIVPICLRDNCVKNNSSKLICCQTKDMKANSEENLRKRITSVSPVSPSPLPDSEHDITYEDVSVGDFPDFSSEDELDTLIKRTKEREKKFIQLFSLSSLIYTSSPLHPNEDSTQSNASTHSKATLILAPEIDAYPPKASPYIQDTPRQTETPLVANVIEKDHLHVYSPTYPTVTPPRIDFIGDFDQGPTTDEFMGTNEVNGRTNLPVIKSEKDDIVPDFSNVKTEIVEDTNCNYLSDAEELIVKRESGSVQSENTDEVIVKHESGCDFPDFMNRVKLDNVEVRNCNSVINTEAICVKLEKGSDVNGNFHANVKFERAC